MERFAADLKSVLEQNNKCAILICRPSFIGSDDLTGRF